MNKNKYNILSVVAIILGGCLLTCCTDDEAGEHNGMVRIDPVFSTAPMVEIRTRASENEPPPIDGERYGDYVAANEEYYPIGTKIATCLDPYTAGDGSVKEFDPDNADGYFSHTIKDGTKKIWTSSVFATENTTYKIFGHVPHDCAARFTYDFKQNIISMFDIKPVNNTDVSVIVGVGMNHYWNEGKTEARADIGAYPCNFLYKPTSDNHNICLLMDHLFARTNFKFAIGTKYHQLRDIKLREVRLSIPEIMQLDAKIPLDTENAGEPKTKKTAIIDERLVWTITKYSDEGITDDILQQYIVNKGWAESSDLTSKSRTELIKLAESHAQKAVVYFNEDGGKQLTETMTLFGPGFFTPLAKPDKPITFQLEVVYDIYDKAGKITRMGATAVNSYTANMMDSEGHQIEVKRGNSYNIQITVEPTYLYQLSEYDLDNPSLIISTTPKS